MTAETTSMIDPSLRIASTHLAVSELERSIDFYERILGLPVISRTADRALLGAEPDRPLLSLTGLDRPRPVPVGSTGLFHVALLHPTRAALAETVRRLAQHGWPLDGASDHGVSEALYLSDPDGLGIEIYVDRPRAQWKRPANGHGVEMFTMPLNIEDLLAHAPGPPATTIATGTVIGHVHLKVSDVPRAISFYRDGLGFEEQAQLQSAGFLSAGGYHHHVGLNSWHSLGGHAPPDSAPGLRLVEFELSSPTALEALERGLSEFLLRGHSGTPEWHERDGRLDLRDPDGNSLSFLTSRAISGEAL